MVDVGELQYGAIITPQFAFGCTGRGRNAMCYGEGDRVIYPVGINVVVYSVSADEMKLLPLADKVARCTAVSLSPNRKYFAVVEEGVGADGPSVGVYSVATEKRVKVLSPAAAGTSSAQVVEMSWSEDSKLLTMQCGEPDFTLLVWRWYSGKVICTLKQDRPVLAAAFNPTDDAQLALVHANGAALVKVDAEAGSASRPTPIQASDQARGAFTGFAWLVGGMLALCTSNGRVQVNQGAELEGVLEPDAEDALTCVAMRGRGLVAGGQKGVIYLYDPPDPAAKRTGKSDAFVLAHTLSCNMPGRSVASLVVSNCQEHLAVLCSSQEMLTLSLEAMQEYEKKGLRQLLAGVNEQDHDPFHLVAGGVGAPGVLGLAAAAFKPLLVVASADKVVRVINYASRMCVVAAAMIDDVLCCAMHPSGSMLLVGLHEKLQLFSVAQHELAEGVAFDIKQCHLLRFSSGGGVFAAAGRSNAIHIIHAYTHAQLHVLRGHVSVVTALSFAQDERSLVSSGAGGAVYFWDLRTGKRRGESEYVDKRALFAAACFVEHEGSAGAVVRASDGRLQHVMEGRVVYEVAGPRSLHRACMAMLGGDRVLVTTDEAGSLLSYPWPGCFPAPPGMAQFSESQAYRIHAPAVGAISHMVTLPTVGLVFTASADGMVMMSQFDLVLRGQLAEVPKPVWSQGQKRMGGEQILTMNVPLERLQASRAKLVELATLLVATKADAEYQGFRQSQALRDALARRDGELADLRAQLEARGAELQRLAASMHDKEAAIVKELEAAHMSAADELEALYEQRLKLEVERLRKRMMERDDEQFRLEERMRRTTAMHESEMAAVKAKHRLELLAAQEHEAVLQGAHRAEAMRFEEYVQQAEGDFEDASNRAVMEVNSIAQTNEQRESALRAEVHLLRRTNLRMKGEKALDHKKMSKVMADNSQLREEVSNAQETVARLRRELKERDEVMEDNFDAIQAHRKRIQELEKHKFVLNYKAETASKELDPLRVEAQAMGADLERQGAELLEEKERSKRLERTLREREVALRQTREELEAARMREGQKDKLLSMFSTDVQAVFQANSERGLEKKSDQQRGVEELHKKYCTVGGCPLTSEQVEAELARHLHMSELQRGMLQRHLEEAKKVTTGAKSSSLHQNSQLLRELQAATHQGRQLLRSLQHEHAQLKALASQHRLLEAKVVAGSRAQQQQQQQQQQGSPTQAQQPGGWGEGRGGAPHAWAVRGSSASASAGGSRPQSASPLRPGSALLHPLPSASAKPLPLHTSPTHPAAGGAGEGGGGGGGSGSPAGLRGRVGLQGVGSMPVRPASASSSVGSYRRPSSGHLHHGSPARGLPEAVASAMDAMALSSQAQDRQRGLLESLQQGVQQQMEEEERAQASAGGNGGQQGGGSTPSALPSHQGAAPRARPSSAHPFTGAAALLNNSSSSCGPTIRWSPARRRPQSAAGVGVRAFVDSQKTLRNK